MAADGIVTVQLFVEKIKDESVDATVYVAPVTVLGLFVEIGPATVRRVAGLMVPTPKLPALDRRIFS